VTWTQLHAEAVARLGSRAEARWLVEEVMGERWPSATPSAAGGVPARARDRFEALLARRAAGEPLQYVLGRWQFRTLDLMVDRRVLIPRPETEQVVEAALTELDAVASQRSPGADGMVALDLGTGSGAIALSLAAERSRLQVWATDVSPAALEVAAANLAGLGGWAAARVRLAEGWWWEAVPEYLEGRIDLVVSNPPYVSSAEMTCLGSGVAEWEPRLSLEAGPTGLEALQEILAGAGRWLRPGGSLVVEISPEQSDPAVGLARDAGLEVAGVRADLTGRDRALVARRQA
jgi:release factor glutamine methyltransferase